MWYVSNEEPHQIEPRFDSVTELERELGFVGSVKVEVDETNDDKHHYQLILDEVTGDLRSVPVEYGNSVEGITGYTILDEECLRTVGVDSSNEFEFENGLRIVAVKSLSQENGGDNENQMPVITECMSLSRKRLGNKLRLVANPITCGSPQYSYPLLEIKQEIIETQHLSSFNGNAQETREDGTDVEDRGDANCESVRQKVKQLIPNIVSSSQPHYLPDKDEVLMDAIVQALGELGEGTLTEICCQIIQAYSTSKGRSSWRRLRNDVLMLLNKHPGTFYTSPDAWGCEKNITKYSLGNPLLVSVQASGKKSDDRLKEHDYCRLDQPSRLKNRWPDTWPKSERFRCINCGFSTLYESRLKAHVDTNCDERLAGIHSPSSELYLNSADYKEGVTRFVSKRDEDMETASEEGDIQDSLSYIKIFCCIDCSFETFEKAELKSHILSTHCIIKPASRVSRSDGGNMSRRDSRRNSNRCKKRKLGKAGIEASQTEVQLCGKVNGIPRDVTKIKKCVSKGSVENTFKVVMDKELKDRVKEIKVNNNLKVKLDSEQDVRERIDKETFDCPKCPAKFYRLGNLVKHRKSGRCYGERETNKSSYCEKEQMKMGSFTCTKCGQCFSRFGNLTKHKKFMCMDEEKVNESYKCSMCDFNTATPQGLTMHVKKHEQPDSVEIHKCSSCGYSTYVKVEFLTDDNPSDSPDRKYKCSYCEFSSTTRSQLKFHGRSFHSNDRHKCIRCGFTDLCRATHVGASKDSETKSQSKLNLDSLKSKDPYKERTPDVSAKKLGRSSRKINSSFRVVPLSAKRRKLSFRKFESDTKSKNPRESEQNNSTDKVNLKCKFNSPLNESLPKKLVDSKTTPDCGVGVTHNDRSIPEVSKDKKIVEKKATNGISAKGTQPTISLRKRNSKNIESVKNTMIPKDALVSKEACSKLEVKSIVSQMNQSKESVNASSSRVKTKQAQKSDRFVNNNNNLKLSSRLNVDSKGGTPQRKETRHIHNTRSVRGNPSALKTNVALLCDHCGRKYRNKTSLAAHMKETHGSCKRVRKSTAIRRNTVKLTVSRHNQRNNSYHPAEEVT